ncbi:MAG: hypothetical protein WCW01_02175 [Gammaproteobacteria bacterium]
MQALYPNMFTYKEIYKQQKGGPEQVVSQDYIGFFPGGAFYEMQKESVESYQNKHGWKFHIALDDSRPQGSAISPNIAKGWDITKQILMNHGVQGFKVVRPEIPPLGLSKPVQGRKQITIYAETETPQRSPAEWAKIFDEITMKLIDAGVQPKLPFTGEVDQHVAGSSFFTYRNEADANGKYVPAEEASGYNPGNHLDPYQGVSLCESLYKNMRTYLANKDPNLLSQIAMESRQLDPARMENIFSHLRVSSRSGNIFTFPQRLTSIATMQKDLQRLQNPSASSSTTTPTSEAPKAVEIGEFEMINKPVPPPSRTIEAPVPPQPTPERVVGATISTTGVPAAPQTTATTSEVTHASGGVMQSWCKKEQGPKLSEEQVAEKARESQSSHGITK